MQKPSPPVLSFSPSFNAYTSANLLLLPQQEEEEFGSSSPNSVAQSDVNIDDVPQTQQQEGEGEEEEEFDFAFVCRGGGGGGGESSSATPADEIFCNGQIRPLFDNTEIFKFKDEETKPKPADKSQHHRPKLGKLLREERQFEFELEIGEGAAPGSYCVWTPPQQARGSDHHHNNNEEEKTSKRWMLISRRKRRRRSHNNNNNNNNNNNSSKEKSSSSSSSSFGDHETTSRKWFILPHNNKQHLLAFISNVNANGGSRHFLHPF